MIVPRSILTVAVTVIGVLTIVYIASRFLIDARVAARAA
jgi:hypothetical protein